MSRHKFLIDAKNPACELLFFATLIIGGIAAKPAAAEAVTNPCTGTATSIPADIYVPVDDWSYSALYRLHALGFLKSDFLGLRPWTRRSIQRMLADVSTDDLQSNQEALGIFLALQREFGTETNSDQLTLSCNQAYSRIQGISGTTLRDSYHLGQSIINDYGRPYQPGFNSIDGAEGSLEFGRFSLVTRMEYQHAPSATGYSPALFQTLSNIDGVPVAADPVQATIPEGPIPQTNVLRIVEANLSYRILNHQISLGKSDHWFAPTEGGAFTYSNNAENIYAFQIDRVEPFYIPLLSRLTGPFRYDFLVGSLKGHSYPNDPWIHIEKINFKPTPNVEFGFERTVIWGGKGHEPVNLHTFLRSFFSTANVSVAQKNSPQDPGARFASFDFSWRLPWLEHWLMLYCDSLVHDDVSPADAPRHAGWRPGLYLSRFPGVPKLDMRVEGVSTDPPTPRSDFGGYLYFEAVQRQGYTNKGFIMGDAIGREGKGGQAWLTYHLSPRDKVQLSYRHVKDAKDFVPLGTTQNSFAINAVKQLGSNFQLSGSIQHEWWKAPVYLPGQQSDTVATFQLTLRPAPAVAP